MSNEPRDANDVRVMGGKLVAKGEPVEIPSEGQTTNGKTSEEKKLPVPQPLSEVTGGAVKELQEWADGKRHGAPLPWPGLAKTLGGGLRPGFHVLVGGTGTGKTQLAMEVALCAARAGTSVLYVGLEMGAIDVTARLLSLIKPGTYWWSELAKPECAAYLRDSEASAKEELAKLPFWCDFGETGGWSYTSIRERSRWLRAQHQARGLDNGATCLVVVDYLQLVGRTPDNPREDLRERIRGAAMAAHDAARNKESRVAVLALSSTARGNYERLELPKQKSEEWLEKTPPGSLVGLGKESGEVEFGATTVLAIAACSTPETNNREVWVAVAKNRNGPVGWHPFTANWGRLNEASGKPSGESPDIDTAGLV